MDEGKLHPQVLKELEYLDKRRDSTIRASKWLYQIEDHLKELYPSVGTDVTAYATTYSTIITITIIDAKSAKDARPMMQALHTDGWDRVISRNNVWNKDDAAWRWTYHHSLDGTLELHINMYLHLVSKGPGCKRVQVGEEEEVTKRPIYKIICNDDTEVPV